MKTYFVIIPKKNDGTQKKLYKNSINPCEKIKVFYDAKTQDFSY